MKDPTSTSQDTSTAAPSAEGAGPTTRAQVQTIALDQPDGFKPIHVGIDVVQFKDRKALRVVDAAPPEVGAGRLLILPGSEIGDGSIEIDVAGDVMGGADPALGPRGFVGVAFHINAGASAFEHIYLRPTNARAEDQVRRNHSVQYAAEPDAPWYVLREQSPEKYESYTDLVPGEWTRMRIEIAGTKARLFVHEAEQPTLIVNDLRLGSATGRIALWIGPGTVAHFSNLRISRPTQ